MSMQMTRRVWLRLLGAMGIMASGKASVGADPAAAAGSAGGGAPKRLYRGRPGDGRFASPAARLHALLKNHRPKLAFDPTMAAEGFAGWRAAVVERLTQVYGVELGGDDDAPVEAKRLSVEPREGYRLETWEAYPDPLSVVSFLVLVPEGAASPSPFPAVLCIPGTDGTKEFLAGEPSRNDNHKWRQHNAMALHFVRQGFVAVAVDSFGYWDDPLHPIDFTKRHDTRLCEISYAGMWLGKPYEGQAVAQALFLLRWMRQQSIIDPQRIAASGHSLGAKHALGAGVLDQRVAAVIHNEVCRRWQSEAVAVNFDNFIFNGIYQYVPGWIAWFDNPDMMAAMAPRPLLVSEGGRTEELERVQAAYRLAGAAENFRWEYYPTYATAEARIRDRQPIPEGLTMEEWHEQPSWSNCDGQNHYFKHAVAVPWLKATFARRP